MSCTHARDPLFEIIRSHVVKSWVFFVRVLFKFFRPLQSILKGRIPRLPRVLRAPNPDDGGREEEEEGEEEESLKIPAGTALKKQKREKKILN